MAKHYVYRIRCDTGFAPHIEGDICTLSGCKNSKDGKRKNIEESAEKGSWVVGIGGNETRQADKLIFAMKVEENLTYFNFKQKNPKESQYLNREKAGSNVLISKKFYYLGNNAIELSKELRHIIWRRPNCRCITDKDVKRLKDFFLKKGYYKYGVYGKPSNSEPSRKCVNC